MNSHVKCEEAVSPDYQIAKLVLKKNVSFWIPEWPVKIWKALYMHQKSHLKGLLLWLKSTLKALVAATAWVEYTDLKEMSAQLSRTTS